MNRGMGPNRQLLDGEMPDPAPRDRITAIGSPHRRRILRILHEAGEARSPNEVAETLGLAVSQASYHLKVLKRCQAVALTDTQPSRGAIEHFYASTIAGDHLVAALLDATRAEDEAPVPD
jgi:DNA-binding transcriptional ArsR family regulator